MKNIFVLLVVLATALTANAQFEKGKAYLGASLSGFDISSQAKKFHFGVNVKAGYLFMDNLMATAQVGYDHLDSERSLSGCFPEVPSFGWCQRLPSRCAGGLCFLYHSYGDYRTRALLRHLNQEVREFCLWPGHWCRCLFVQRPI